MIESGAMGDYFIDMIESGAMGDYFIDLKFIKLITIC